MILARPHQSSRGLPSETRRRAGDDNELLVAELGPRLEVGLDAADGRELRGGGAWAWRCGAAAALSGPRRGRVALFMQHSEDPYLEIRELLERSGRGGGGKEQPQATRHGQRGSF